MYWHLTAKHNKRLHADAQTYAAFVGFAALHFTTKASPVWALVSLALYCKKINRFMNEPSKIEKKVLSNVNEKKILVDRSRIIGALAVCGLPVMLISGMVFDAPGSENYIGAWIAFSILISFTPICILSLIVSWVLKWLHYPGHTN